MVILLALRSITLKPDTTVNISTLFDYALVEGKVLQKQSGCTQVP